MEKNKEIVIDKYYMEKIWIPHISLAVKLCEKTIHKGKIFMEKYFKNMEIKVNRISLAECNPYKEIKTWDLKEYKIRQASV